LELSELQRLKSIYIVASVLNQDSNAVGEIAILRAIAWATVVACAGCGLVGGPTESDEPLMQSRLRAMKSLRKHGCSALGM
jgi:hypothetical protein